MQDARDRPEHNPQRKAAIARGGVFDHAGRVQVHAIENFSLDHTIFNTLQGAVPRFVIRTRIGKETRWNPAAASEVEEAYQTQAAAVTLPTLNPALLAFLKNECDFNVEHADGSFLDHLYFCFEYNGHHLPQYSPLVSLLHSILGTGTNTFAMGADKIPTLKGFLSDFEWRHVSAFPSLLRLLYDLPLRRELHQNRHRFSDLKEVSFHRVIDNKPISLSGEDFWVQLNYQLLHLVDFLPVANWALHKSDPAFVVFRDLYRLLRNGGKMEAKIDYRPPAGPRQRTGEAQSLGARLVSRIPVTVSEKLAAKSVREFSSRVGHSLSYSLSWS